MGKRDVAWGFFWDVKPLMRADLLAFSTRKAALIERAKYKEEGAYTGPIFRITPPKLKKRRNA